MLSPALFVLYTAHCRSKEEGNVMIKFADDTSSLIEIDSSYRELVMEELTE